jgi:hypothetical protein
MLSYPATISLSSRTLNHLTDCIRGHRQQRKTGLRQREHSVQAAPLPAEAVTPAEGGQPGAREDPRRGERAIATLKPWRILAKLRCCPRRATAIVHAVLVLHHVEANRYAG